MQTQAVFTNLTCNQNCTYCTKRLPAEDPAFVRAAAVRARIDDAVLGGARELVLTGGEPTLRRDLASLVAYARARGAERIVLETNATLIDATMADALRTAGVTLVRVNLSGLGPTLDHVTRDPGGAEAAERGVLALLAAGNAVEVSVAIVEPTVADVRFIPQRVARLDAGRGLIRSLVVRVPTESPDARALVSYAAAAEAIVALEAAARAESLSVRISPDASIPPCVFPPKARIAHLFSLTRGVHPREGMRHAAACSRCQVADACLGLPEAYIARFGTPDMRPIDDDRARRRLTIISSVEEQMRREFVTPNRSTHDQLGLIEEDIIRVHFHCNQSCRFCFVSTHLPAMDDASIREAIASAAARGVKVTLSGGEPTLNPRLVEYMRLASDATRYPVQLQSNAIRLDDAALVAQLIDAGMREAFISLHGSTAEVSDAVTEAPGTFARTVVGLDNLHATDVSLIINFVICERNMGDLGNMVRLIAARWPRAMLNVSFVAPSSDVVPRDRAFIPKYTQAMPFIAEAVRDAASLGVHIGGFESMCGIPLCLVPSSLEKYFSLDEVPPGFDRGEFVKPPACADCALSTRCYGLRTGYQQLHGADELRPVAAVRSTDAAPVANAT